MFRDRFCETCLLLLGLAGLGQNLRFIKQEDADPNLLVRCNEGFLQGTLRQTFRKQLPYRSYQGIPFAKPPVGPLRFKDPFPVTNWSGILDATEENVGCTSTVFFAPYFEVIPRNSTEDCLYLNVYVPEIAGNVDLLPVILWIYGGSFAAGSSNVQFHGPDYYLENGIIVITVNYRLGIFGFLSTGDLECPGNMALKDQHMALLWTSRNVRYFGGDPATVTLAGQSAGAASVHYQALAGAGGGGGRLFRGAIIQSGSALHPWAVQRRARDVAFEAGRMLGVRTTDSAELLRRMRTMDVDRLTYVEDTLLSLYMVSGAGADLAFAPVIEPEHKGAFITKRSYDACKNGDFARVPIITGVTSQEIGLFQTVIRAVQPLMLLADVFQGSLIFRNFDFDSPALKNEAIQIAKNKYLRDGKLAGSTIGQIAQFLSHNFFVRPSVKMAQFSSPYVPVYFYQLTYMGPSGLKSIKQDSRLVKGVFHAEELFYMWRRNDTPVLTKSDETFVDTLSTLWSNFVKYGNPTPSKDPKLNNIIWDPINTPKVNHLRIGKQLTMKSEVDFIDMNFWDNLLEKYAKKPFTTY